MTASKRHHFTPRYYLKNFHNTEGKIWRLDKASGRVVRGDHNSFGLKKNWNTLVSPPQGYGADWAEKRIALVDTYASKALTKLLKGDFSADMRALAFAMSFMQHHQPKLKESLKEKHPERVSKWSDDWFLIVGLKTAFREAQNYIPAQYAVLQVPPSKAKARFLTSSNPVVSFSNKPSLFFPISSSQCLLMTKDAHAGFGEPRHFECDERMVEGINDLIVQNAWQYIYSDSESFGLAG